ncbi:MAG: hypothetical protein IJD09_00835, partial [Clostridia bacterium]|nr:hypothetical protein [Clostridia bacterium]
SVRPEPGSNSLKKIIFIKVLSAHNNSSKTGLKVFVNRFTKAPFEALDFQLTGPSFMMLFNFQSSLLSRIVSGVFGSPEPPPFLRVLEYNIKLIGICQQFF